MNKGTAEDPIALLDDGADYAPSPQSGTKNIAGRRSSGTAAKTRQPPSKPKPGTIVHDLTLSDDEALSLSQKKSNFMIQSLYKTKPIVGRKNSVHSKEPGPLSKVDTPQNEQTPTIQHAQQKLAVASPQKPITTTPVTTSMPKTTNLARAPHENSASATTNIKKPTVLPGGRDNTPDLTTDASGDTTSPNRMERMQRESAPDPVPLKITATSASPSSITSLKINNTHPTHTIPIRTTAQPAAVSIALTNEALVPDSPRARLAYVMNPKHRNSTNHEPENDVSSHNEKQPVTQGLCTGSIQAMTAGNQPVKHARARKTAHPSAQSNQGRVSPSTLRKCPVTMPKAPASSEHTESPEGALADEAHSIIQKPKSVISTLPSHLAATAELSSERHAKPETESSGCSGLGHNPTTMPQAMNVDGLEAATAIVEERLKDHLRHIYQLHAKNVRSAMAAQRRCFEREGGWKERSWTHSTAPALASTEAHLQPSPFKKMRPIQKILGQKSSESFYFSQEIFTKSRTKAGIVSKITAPITTFRSTAINVPPFRSYVGLQDNTLAENERTLLNWPYFPDDMDREDMTEDLEKSYKMKNVTHKWHDLLSEVHKFYNESVEAFLADMELSWNDILYWYLASDNTILRINSELGQGKNDFERVILKGDVDLDYRFDREAPKWQGLLERLVRPSGLKIRLTALVAITFRKLCDFDLWHIARRSDLIQQEVAGSLDSNTAKLGGFEYRQPMCRVCHMQNCSFHGELREQPEQLSFNRPSTPPENNEVDSSWAQADYSSDESLTDSDIEDVDNYRRVVNAHTHSLISTDKDGDLKQIPKPVGEFKAQWWLTNTNAATWEHRKPFYPCSHEGTCDQARCRCYTENITCEKSCECSTSCKRRFPGCSCSQLGAKGRLCGTKQCLCYAMNRECDAGLCGSCGARELLNPVDRDDENISADKCCNVALQRGVHKKTLLGNSEVHGFGLFAGEDIKQGDFIGEYKGEVITVSEGYRRGIIYEKQQTMYLFRLNSEQEVDSTNFGNKTRFINNSNREGANCGPRNLLCNTVHRIGLFANRDIPAGTELFFHYGYPDAQTKHFKEPGGKKSTKLVAVKQTKKDLTRVRASTPERRRQTAKARATLLAKRRDKDGSPRSDKEKASVTAPPKPAGRAIKSAQRRPPLGSNIRATDVQESDHDEDYIPDGDANALDEPGGPVSEDDGSDADVSESLSRRRRGVVRQGIAPVLVAMHGKRSTRSPLVRKKRKRLVVVSDGEDS